MLITVALRTLVAYSITPAPDGNGRNMIGIELSELASSSNEGSATIIPAAIGFTLSSSCTCCSKENLLPLLYPQGRPLLLLLLGLKNQSHKLICLTLQLCKTERCIRQVSTDGKFGNPFINRPIPYAHFSCKSIAVVIHGAPLNVELDLLIFAAEQITKTPLSTAAREAMAITSL